MDKSCETPEKSKNIKDFLKSSSFWKPALGVALGGIAGFLYYNFVGCASGSCGITSNPYTSILFGSMLGLFLVKSPCRSC
jgi:hypothetical protein